MAEKNVITWCNFKLVSSTGKYSPLDELSYFTLGKVVSCLKKKDTAHNYRSWFKVRGAQKLPSIINFQSC